MGLGAAEQSGSEEIKKFLEEMEAVIMEIKESPVQEEGEERSSSQTIGVSRGSSQN